MALIDKLTSAQLVWVSAARLIMTSFALTCQWHVAVECVGNLLGITGLPAGSEHWTVTLAEPCTLGTSTVMSWTKGPSKSVAPVL